ncbi:TPA: polysaccharide pyruvyl transferase family protein [Vibrio metoecus]
MKIAILTQPLSNNYGGLLQAFALQYYLKTQGHDVLTIDFSSKNYLSFWSGTKSVISNFIRKYILRRKIKSIFPIKDWQKCKIEQHTSRFTAEYIRTTQKIYTIDEFEYIKNYRFDAYIVGSDQVWRPIYSPGMAAFFLCFLNKYDNVKRIAYAASFGVDNTDEFRAEQIEEYASLLQRFDAVGVREESALELCYQKFGVQAEHVIDPTLLLDKDVYCDLVTNDNIPPSDGNMMVYVLDKAPEKQSIISEVARIRGLKPYSVMRDDDGIYPPVTKWLRGFMDAEYIVTDSFHGVVFSIIFNKPFIAIGNHVRGLARFTSVLNMFDLTDRLIFENEKITDNIINSEIDYSRVNAIKSELKTKSQFFLKRELNYLNNKTMTQ